jgi:hypothetical protein
MNLDWQLAIALVFVAAAVFILARRAVRLVKGRGRSAGSCASGGCSGCSAEPGRSQAPSGQVIPVESLLERRGRS